MTAQHSRCFSCDRWVLYELRPEVTDAELKRATLHEWMGWLRCPHCGRSFLDSPLARPPDIPESELPLGGRE